VRQDCPPLISDYEELSGTASQIESWCSTKRKEKQRLRDERKREKKRAEKVASTNMSKNQRGSHSKKKGIQQIAAVGKALTDDLELAFLNASDNF